ncbi:MAG: glycosyltransferase family 4 protein [Candidatus Bathyarchaeia archaeon]
MDFTLACDIMLDLGGSIRPPMYLATELSRRGYRVSMVSPTMSKRVEQNLKAAGIQPINLKARLFTKRSGNSVLWFETWFREALLKLNSRRSPNGPSRVINFSQIFSTPALVWYLQGPPSLALRDMEEELSTGFRLAYDFLKGIIDYADEKLIKQMYRDSSVVIANSKFCASLYTSFGVKTDDVIYPPIDCGVFAPSTSKPTSDYVLTYFGKETKYSAIKSVADQGVHLKAFGSKTKSVPENVLRHPNIECLGWVDTPNLVRLYSNALFTLFPFTHEPFGYVPLESMACGTPVVTYDSQGPSECVVNDHTGWLVRTDEEMTQKTVGLWKENYTPAFRRDCVRKASEFDRKHYVEKWLRVLEST